MAGVGKVGTNSGRRLSRRRSLETDEIPEWPYSKCRRTLWKQISVESQAELLSQRDYDYLWKEITDGAIDRWIVGSPTARPCGHSSEMKTAIELLGVAMATTGTPDDIAKEVERAAAQLIGVSAESVAKARLEMSSATASSSRARSRTRSQAAPRT